MVTTTPVVFSVKTLQPTLGWKASMLFRSYAVMAVELVEAVPLRDAEHFTDAPPPTIVLVTPNWLYPN